jgi:hypothetical protein
MSHTSGPWRQFKPLDDDDDYREIAGGNGFTPNGFSVTGFVSEDDARLLAAAPDLLEACRAMMKGSEYKSITIEGETLAPHWASIKMPGENALNKARAAIANAEGHDP